MHIQRAMNKNESEINIWDMSIHYQELDKIIKKIVNCKDWLFVMKLRKKYYYDFHTS